MTSRSEVRGGGALGILARYADMLPVTPQTPRLTLGEGNTPLVRAESLERRTGARAVYLQLESCNPTGSFKDRGMVVAVAKAGRKASRRALRFHWEHQRLGGGLRRPDGAARGRPGAGGQCGTWQTGPGDCARRSHHHRAGIV